MAFMDFINWFNPMHLNGSKTLSKWVARFDLGLSTSLPVVRFEPEHIQIIPDEHPPNAPRPIPTEQVLTDGCGYMNKAALAAIGKQIGAKDGVPTAVQGRILGSKGLWTLHPTDTLLSAPPRIWIRDSQLKVNLVTDYTPALLSQLDKAHFVFNLVAPARVSTPTRLNKDAIINLAHNGVPKDVIVKLMKDSLEEELAPYVQWEGNNSMSLLWNQVDKAGHVTMTHIQQRAAGFTRALGLTGRLPESDDETDESKVLSSISTTSSSSSSVSAVSVSSIASSSSSSSWERPETVHDEIMALIQAGFSPLQCRTLYESLRQLITNVMRKFVSEYHINVQKSADAFLIPDPCNVLKPGQIFFKSSKLLKDPLEDDNPNYILGDVLLYRNPCRLPSDIQKVTAVKEPLLESYVDVIVLSIQGDSSAASLLAGGDYDGDTGVCIFDEVLVQNFTNSQLCIPPANFEKVNFEPKDNIPTVKVFHQHTSLFTPHDVQVNLQQYLLAPIKQMQIGLYSKFHDVVTYAWGYDNPESIRTAFMFNLVLDSRKSGLVVKDSVWQQDRKRFNYDPPECMDDSNKPSSRDPHRLRRQVPGPFILDQLLKAGKEIENRHLVDYDQLWRDGDRTVLDEDLLGPWNQAQEAAKSFEGLVTELKLIEDHVKECYGDWAKIWKDTANKSFQTVAEGKITKRGDQMKVKRLEQKFLRGPEGIPILTGLGRVKEIIASCAYAQRQEKAFKLAFRTLCDIKARSKGGLACTFNFGQNLSFSSTAAKVMAKFT
ncbi:RNA-dependent RNA polymerase [Abortiporus biennis]